MFLYYTLFLVLLDNNALKNVNTSPTRAIEVSKSIGIRFKKQRKY